MEPGHALAGAWLNSAESWIGLAADLTTVAVVVVGFLLTRRMGIVVSRSLSRWLSFRGATANEPRVWCLRARDHYRRTDELFGGSGVSVAAELDWLAGRRLGLKVDESFPLAGSATGIRALARAYDEQAARLDARALVNTKGVPALAREASLYRGSSDRLRVLAAAQAVGATFRPTTCRVAHRGLSLTLLAGPGSMRRASAFDLVVSFRARLLAPALPGASWQPYADVFGVDDLELDEHTLAKLREKLSSRDVFDGVLPRLVQWRTEHDLLSGRQRLHLGLAATTYSAVIADHYCGRRQVQSLTPAGGPALRPQGVQEADVTGENVRVVTLSLVPETSDGFLVFADRSSAAGSHEGRLGPAANGNLELASRGGVTADFDANGFPDPVRALVREAREEIGIELGPEQVWISGLARFDSPTERGTYVLTATARLKESLDEVAKGVRNADMIEGRWEVGSRLLGVPVPTTATDTKNVERWLWGCAQLMPHSTAAGLAALGVLGITTAPTRHAINHEVPLPAGSRSISL